MLGTRLGNHQGALASARAGAIMTAFLIGMLLLAAILSGCSVAPVDQQGIRDAWAAREAERAAECRRKNVGYAAGGCVAGGP